MKIAIPLRVFATFQLNSNQRATAIISEDCSTSDSCAAPGAAIETVEGPIDLDLHLVIEAWKTLPEATKVGILAMVRAAK